MCFCTKSLFSTGHLSWFDVLCMSLSLSLCSLLHSYIRWSTVWLPPSQEHSGDSVILKRCRYALVFPWAVTKTVKFGVSLMLVDSLSLMFGKKCFVVCMCVWVLYVCMRVCMYARVCVCKVCTYVCMHACMYVCVYVCISTYVFMYVCMYVRTYVRTYVCVYMYVWFSLRWTLRWMSYWVWHSGLWWRERRFGGSSFIHFYNLWQFYHEGGDRTISRKSGTFFFGDSNITWYRQECAISKVTELFKNSEDSWLCLRLLNKYNFF